MMRPVASAIGLAVALAAALPAISQGATRTIDGIEDIQVTEDAGRVSILVKLSGQPRGAAAWAETGGVRIDIDGIQVAAMSLAPPAGRIVSRVATSPAPDGATTLRLSGVALEDFSTTLYRNAVLVSARMADPAVAPALPPPAETPVAPAGAAGIAGLDQAGCLAAATALAKDGWDIEALGNRALCAIDAADLEIALPLLGQLESFAPDDWRVALGHAAMAQARGDAGEAIVQYRNALTRASEDPVRGAIADRLDLLDTGWRTE